MDMHIGGSRYTEETTALNLLICPSCASDMEEFTIPEGEISHPAIRERGVSQDKI